MWDAIASFFSPVVEAVSSIPTPVVAGGAVLGGALLSSSANKEAAKRVGEASTEAARINADALLESQRLADERLEKQRRESEPAMQYLRRVMSQDPSMLTPEQETAHADYLRDANARLAASGLRGAGRAGVAAVNRADQDFRNRAFTDNQRRADMAAQGIAGDYRQAARDLTNLDVETVRGIGAGNARATERSGDIGAGADLATANQWGSAMGMIGSLIADERKGRESIYPRPGRQRANAAVTGYEAEAV